VSIITANTTATVTVLSDMRAVADPSDFYQIDDYRLQPGPAGSPCIDAADNFAVADCVLDLDGNERFVNDLDTEPDTGNGTPPIVDMGAYEFGGLPLPDCNNDGSPDECEEDCQPNGFADDCDIANGTSEDCTNNGVPDECELDCNGNGVADSCDIASGTSGDCNGNGIPDDCDIASETSEDGCGNGIPDECELVCDPGTEPESCCPADFDDDGAVAASDLAILLGTWGFCGQEYPCVRPDCACEADFDYSCFVDAFDLATFLGAWGPCP
jgi:hypothetical protein